jgi:hypothetical protein
MDSWINLGDIRCKRIADDKARVRVSPIHISYRGYQAGEYGRALCTQEAKSFSSQKVR